MAEQSSKDLGGAPLGNRNALRAARWRKALEREVAALVADTEPDRLAAGLDVLARKVVAMAQAGDWGALQEIGNRMDGKPVQSISAPDGGAIPVIDATKLAAMSGEDLDRIAQALKSLGIDIDEVSGG